MQPLQRLSSRLMPREEGMTGLGAKPWEGGATPGVQLKKGVCEGEVMRSVLLTSSQA